MGAVRCLYEAYGFRPDVIASTSVGSVNGVKLASAPPPANNDAAAILAAMRNGQVDGQLTQMRELEQLWQTFLSPSDFFAVRAPFKNTVVEEAVRRLNAPSDSAPFNITVNSMLDAVSALISIPLINLIAGPVTASELQKIRYLIDKIATENSVLDLSPVESKLRDISNLDPVALAGGTALYMAMVSLETGRLRYVTNKGEFYERDGVTPVATALTDADIDAAIDENLQALSAPRSALIKSVVSEFKATVNQIAAYRTEYNASNTTDARRRVLSRLITQQAERGNYLARAAKAQITGLTITAKVNPIVGVLGSACMPAYFDPPLVGVERYVDGGVREIIPVEIVLKSNPDLLVGIVCSANELPETDSMNRAGIIAVAMRSLADIALEEVVVGDMAVSGSRIADVRFVIPEFNVHDTVVVDPPLIEISMHYGWMRAADVMQPATLAERESFSLSSRLLTRMRLQCLALERRIDQTNFLDIDWLKAQYWSLRATRWAIMHVAARRNAWGLPAHPTQGSWSIDWERQRRGITGTGEPNVWAKLESRSSDDAFQADLWPVSSPMTFNPDIGAVRDTGSLRIYWMVRGAIFESVDGSLPAAGPTIEFANGTHQFLPRIPSGVHLMAEVQAPGQAWLVAGGKRYAAPTGQMIATAGLTKSGVALVPTGSLAQIPDGGAPTFLADLAFIDQANRPVEEVVIERIEQSDTMVNVYIFNRNRAAARTNVSLTISDFDAREGVTVESAPVSFNAFAIDFATLHLKPTRSGNYTGSIAVTSDDPLFPVLTVPLRLRVLPLGDLANLRFTPATLDINARVNSTSSYAVVTLTNEGAIAATSMSYTFEPVAAATLFVPGTYLRPADFQPARDVRVPIFFYPTVTGRFDAQMVITYGGNTSNGIAYQQTARIPLVGHAVAAKIKLARSRSRSMPVKPTDLSPSRFAVDLQGGQLVSNRLPISALQIDVGTIQPPVSDVTRFFIGNVGDASLEIALIRSNLASLSPAHNLAFPFNIAPGEQQEVRLDLGLYTRLDVGHFSETVRILCNDPAVPEATVTLDGSVGGAKVRIQPEFINFDQVALGSASILTVNLENIGTSDLQITKVAWQSGSQFRLLQGPQLAQTLAAGTSLPMSIECRPLIAGFASDQVVIDTDQGVKATLVMQARAM